jgi:D-alanyl-D-alanine carboxypeptidase
VLSFLQITITPAKTEGTEAVDKVTYVSARIGQCIWHALKLTVLTLTMALTPLGVFAAPYADMVIDARTGQVLHETNANTRLHPASLTKMMTLYITFQAIEHGEITLDTMVTVSKYAASQPPSRLGLKAGQRIAMRYLIRAAAIKSANDAAAAIGDAIEGNRDAFAARMNRTAKALGMTRTSFRNANGLTAEGHLSTAHDMTILGRRLFFDFPQYYNIFSRRSADAGVAQVNSTNRRFLDSYEGADGIKTGYTNPAGFNLVASAQRGNVRIIATVFGGTSTAQRNARVAELLDMGFSKAPARAKEQRPPAIAYLENGNTNDAASQDLLAEAVAGDVNTSAPPAGKTLRLQVAVASSPRPRHRSSAPEPADASMMVASLPDAAASPAAVQQAAAEDSAIVAGASDMAFAAEETSQALQDSIALALAEAQEIPDPSSDGFVQTTAPQPETLALGQADGEEPPVLIAATDSAPANTLHPVARPAAVLAAATAAAPVAIASAEPAAVDTVQVAELAPADALAPTQVNQPSQTSALPDEDLILPAEDLTTPVDPANTDLAAAVVLTPSPEAEAQPEPPVQEIVLAAAPTAETADAPLEVVTRVSTSGGRGWGINVGNYSSRYKAEHQLLRTALVEMGTLGEAQSAVSQSKGAFNANFVGMTEDAANMACRRLTARGTECAVLSPGA